MSSGSSRRTDDTYQTLPPEYDSTDRNANFFLYTRPLNDAVLQHSDDITLHHWSLVAVFDDESMRTMEAFESGGRLVPAYIKEAPREQAGNKPGKYWDLVPLKTSPLKLRTVTMNVSSNGSKYKAKSNNCQTWLKDFAKAISSKLASALDNYKSCREVSTVGATLKCSFASSASSSQSVRSALVKCSNSAFSRAKAIEHHHLD